MAEDGEISRGSDRVSEGSSEQAETRQNFSSEAVETDRNNGSNAAAQNEQNRMDSQQMANDGQVGNLTLTDDQGGSAQAERGIKNKQNQKADSGKPAAGEKEQSAQELGNDLAHDIHDPKTGGQLSTEANKSLGKAAEKAYAKDGEAGLKKLSEDVTKGMKDAGSNRSLEIVNQKEAVGRDYHEVVIKGPNGTSSGTLNWDQPKKAK